MGRKNEAVPKHVDDEPTDKQLTPEFWERYNNGPVLRREFHDDHPRPPTNKLYPDENFARWTADALGLKASDWDDPNYREVYTVRLIIAETATTFWLVSGGKCGALSLDRFVEEHKGQAITVHGYDVVKDIYALEITPELVRRMKELGYEMRPIKPGGDNRRAR